MDLDDLGSTKVGSDMDVVVMKDYTIGMKFKTNDWVIVCFVLELHCGLIFYLTLGRDTLVSF